MKVTFEAEAELELISAVRRYDHDRDGLGLEFLDEVRSALQRVQTLPEAWEKMSSSTRCCRTHRFPYGIIYQIRADEIVVFAVAHLHRRPGYWRDRVRDDPSP